MTSAEKGLEHPRARRAKLSGLGTVALVPGANLRYFTGLTLNLSERPTIAFMEQKLWLVMPEVGPRA